MLALPIAIFDSDSILHRIAGRNLRQPWLPPAGISRSSSAFSFQLSAISYQLSAAVDAVPAVPAVLADR
jgi:hypothetical protein